MGIPAGWYQDLEGSGSLRWWDGEAWTSATRARSDADGPPPGASERLESSGAPVNEPEVPPSAPIASDSATGWGAVGVSDVPRASAPPSGPAGPGTAAAPVAPSAMASDPSAPVATAPEVPWRAAEVRLPLDPEPAGRASRTVRIDDRELGHLLDVVPDAPAHLLPIPPAARAPRRAWLGRTARVERPDRGTRPERPASADRVERRERAERPDRVERPERMRRARSTSATRRSTSRADGGRGRANARPRATARASAPPRDTGPSLVVAGLIAALLAGGWALLREPELPVAEPPAPVEAPATQGTLPNLGAPGADGGPEGELSGPRLVELALGGPCGTVEVEVAAGVDVSTLRAWDAPACALAPVALEPGTSRWIIVRASLNGAASDEPAARATARRLTADGVLWSTYYASLNPDLWVVFDGPFPDEATAAAAASAAGGGAYERVLSDDEADRFCIAADGCTGGVARD